jgi:NADPH2:quinone reductase
MDAFALQGPSGTGSLQRTTIEKPTPAADEVRVAVHATSLNPSDAKTTESAPAEWEYPFIPGIDVAGVIDAVGEEVTNWEIGNAVYFHCDLSRNGSFAEYVTTPVHVLAPLPANLSFSEAAGVPSAGFTAYQALHHRLGIEAGETILIHGGSGGVGGYAVQLANLAGLDIYTTCSPENDAFARSLGANVTIDYHTEDPIERVLELTDGRGVDAVVDTVGGTSATEALDALAFGGGLACIVDLPDIESYQKSDNCISIHEIFLGGAYIEGDYWSLVELAEIGREMGQLLTNGSIDPMVGEIIPFDDIPTGLERLSSGQTPPGKVVVQLN